MSSSCLSRSASSFARQRIWRATSARRCSSSARRSSRLMLLCVSVGMVVDFPIVWLCDCRHPSSVWSGALAWPPHAPTDSTTDAQPIPALDRRYRKWYSPTGSAARSRACLSSSMAWSSAPARRVCTPRFPRRQFTGRRVAAVARGYGLRDNLARASARIARMVRVWPSVKLKRHGFECGRRRAHPTPNAATCWPQFGHSWAAERASRQWRT